MHPSYKNDSDLGKRVSQNLIDLGLETPVTDKVKTHFDKNEHANIFYVTDSKPNAFFHSVFSDTNRFSLGFNIF